MRPLRLPHGPDAKPMGYCDDASALCTPEPQLRLNQIYLQPVLERHLNEVEPYKSLVSIRRGWDMGAFTNGADGVVAEATHQHERRVRWELPATRATACCMQCNRWLAPPSGAGAEVG